MTSLSVERNAVKIWRAAVLIALAIGASAWAQQGPPPTPAAPRDVSSTGTIATESEPGKRLMISGEVFAPDGTTPAPGVIVYAYQTDNGGEYHNDPTTHVARLHGWAKTDAEGRYAFRTIRPGPYPGRTIAAHIHFHIYGGGYPLQWTPELMFSGDPLLQPEQIRSSAALGKFANVQPLVPDESGGLHCVFNIRASSTSNYPAGTPREPQ
jgi:protocatechuate 3,4-dioxygenase beta subunit